MNIEAELKATLDQLNKLSLVMVSEIHRVRKEDKEIDYLTWLFAWLFELSSMQMKMEKCTRGDQP